MDPQDFFFFRSKFDKEKFDISWNYFWNSSGYCATVFGVVFHRYLRDWMPFQLFLFGFYWILNNFSFLHIFAFLSSTFTFSFGLVCSCLDLPFIVILIPFVIKNCWWNATWFASAEVLKKRGRKCWSLSGMWIISDPIKLLSVLTSASLNRWSSKH